MILKTYFKFFNVTLRATFFFWNWDIDIISISVFCVISQYQENRKTSGNEITNFQVYWDTFTFRYISYISFLFVEDFSDLLIQNFIHKNHSYWKIKHCCNQSNNFSEKWIRKHVFESYTYSQHTFSQSLETCAPTYQLATGIFPKIICLYSIF